MSGVEIRVRSNSRQAQRDLSNLERSVGKIEKTTASLTRTFQRLAVGIGTAFAGSALTKSVNRTTDSLTNMENRVALVTGRTKELNKTLDQLYNISRRTGQPVDLAAETFNRFGLALSDAGKSSKDILKAVESVNKSIAISGGGVESARAALTQLGQGLASGQLRGEELNSVLEQAPRLAQAIADSLGKPRGALRDLAQEGKLTTDVVFNALLSQADKLNEEFATLEFTSASAFITVKDQLGRVTAEISKQLNITSTFTNKFLTLSKVIEANRTEIVGSVVTGANQLKASLSGALSVIRGFGRIAEATLGRAFDALPNITAPMLTLSQTVGVTLVTAFLKVNALLTRFGLNLEAIYERLLGTRFQGAINRIFRARSLQQFGDALYSLGDAIDSYGRRWFNFGNLAERAFRKASISLFEAGVFLGIFDQRLARLRYESFERFGKAFGAISKILSDVKKNFLASDIFVSLKVAFINLTILANNFLIAIDNLSGNRISAAFNKLKQNFQQVFSVANTQLSKTSSVVKTALTEIERMFFWVYDKVIGNSWWTDTMEQTYALAQKWLPKTTNFVKSFASEISEVYKSISSILNSRLSRNQKISFSASIVGISIKKSESVKAAQDFAKSFVNSLSETSATLLTSIREVSPKVAGLISLAIGAGILKGLQPNVFAATLAKFGPLFSLAIFTGVVTAFDNAVLKSGFFESVARGLGNAVGEGLDVLVSNIPQIAKLLIRVASEFGKGLAETIGNSFIGLPAKILSFIPGGGLLTTLLYGGATAAIFFSGIRSKLVELIKSLVQVGTSSGALKYGGFLDNFFLGKDPAVQRNRIVSSNKGLLKTLSADAAENAARSSRIQLSSIAGFIIGAEVLLGDLIGTTGAAIVGIGGSIISQAILGDPAKVDAVVTTFNKVLSSVASKIKGVVTSTTSTGAVSGLFTNFLNSAKGNLGSLTATNVVAGSSFSRVWQTSTNKASTFFGKFSSSSIKRLGKISLLVVGVTTLLTGFANAAAEEGERAAGGIDLVSLALIGLGAGLGDTLFDKLGDGFSKLASKFEIGDKLKGIGGRLGGALTTGFSGALRILPAILGGIVAGAGIAAAGLLAVAVFGEGDSFGEKLSNELRRLGLFFGLVKIQAKDARESIRKDLLVARNNVTALKDSGLNSASNQIAINFNNLRLNDKSSKELAALERVAKDHRNLTRKASEEQRILGRVTEATRKQIEANTKLTAERLLSPNATKNTADAAATVSNKLLLSFSNLGSKLGINASDRRAISEAVSDGIAVDKIEITPNATKNIFGLGGESRGLTEQEKFFARLEAGQFDTSSPEGRVAFAEQALFAGGNKMPEYLRDILLVLQRGDNLTGAEVDAIENALNKLSDPALLGIGASGGITLPGTLSDLARSSAIAEDPTGASQSEIEEAFKRGNATRLLQARLLEIEAFFGDLEKITGRTFDNIARQSFDPAERRDLGSVLKERDNFLKRNLENTDVDFEEFILLGDNQRKSILDGLLKGWPESIQREFERINAEITAKVSAFSSITPQAVSNQAGLNNQLQDAGFSALPNAVIGSEELENVKDQLQSIYSLRSEISLLSLTPEDAEKNAEAISAKTQEVFAASRALNNELVLVDNNYAGITNRVQTIGDAFSTYANTEFDLNKILALDPATLSQIVAAQLSIKALQLQIAATASEGGKVDSAASAALAAEQVELNKKIDGLLSGGKLGLTNFKGGGTKENPFEKFISGLSLAGFNLELKEAASLSQKVFEQLKAPVAAVQKLTKKIAESSLNDAKGRQAAVKALKEQEAIIFNILSKGNVADSRPAFESLGLDPNTASKETLAIGLKIKKLQEDLLATGGLDIENKRAISREIEYQESLIYRLTEGAMAASDSIRSAFAESFKSLLKGKSSISDFFSSLLDTISNQIIDTVVDSFTQAFFRAAGLDTMFDTLFAALSGSGSSLGEQVGGQVVDSIKTTSDAASSEEGGGIFAGLGKGLKGMFSGIGESLSGIFGSMGGGGSGLLGMLGGMGGGGGLFSSIFGSTFGSFLGFMNTGGIVPSTPFSQTGKDSVPTMLTPGELVVPANKVNDFKNNSNGSSSSVFNINVSGDVTRQTRKEVAKMIPEITAGVNMTNKERRGR